MQQLHFGDKSTKAAIIGYKGRFVLIMEHLGHNEHLMFVFAHFDNFLSPFLMHTKAQSSSP